MESSSSDSRAPPRLTTFLRAHFRERSGDKKGDDVDRYWYASDVDEAYVARAKQMGEEEGGFNSKRDDEDDIIFIISANRE